MLILRGKIHNGGIVFDEPIPLPEGTKVTCVVTPVKQELAPEQPKKKGTLADLLEFAGIITDTSPDGSENHVKYIYDDPH